MRSGRVAFKPAAAPTDYAPGDTDLNVDGDHRQPPAAPPRVALSTPRAGACTVRSILNGNPPRNPSAPVAGRPAL